MTRNPTHMPSGAVLEQLKLLTSAQTLNQVIVEAPEPTPTNIPDKSPPRRAIIERKPAFQPALLQSLVREGLPQGSNVSLIGPPGVGKTIFCENLASDFLKNNGYCIYVTLDKAPDDVKNDFQALGRNLPQNELKKRLVFVDGFGWLVGKSKENYRIENLANLTELSIRIASAACDLEGPVLLVFDSVSPLPVYNPENVVVKFLQLLLARVKDWKGMGIYVIQEGVHSDEFCNTLGYLVDGILDMKMTEEKGRITRHFRIRSLKFAPHETKWIPFEIQSNRKLKLKPKRGGN